MRVDIHALQRFYASRLGETAQRMAARRIEALWPPGNGGLDMLGLGYATPFLEPFRAGARRVVALMPGAQGAERWPGEGKTLSAMGDETRLPFMDSLFDRVLVVHALEEADNPRALLREIWRVTAPEGRLLIVAANRMGAWALSEATPFGHGRPYSRPQLAQLLSDCLFEPALSAKALYAPPWNWGPALSVADGLERAGEFIAPAFGGLVLMEAVKRLTATPAQDRAKVLLARAPAQRKPAAAHADRAKRRPLP